MLPPQESTSNEGDKALREELEQLRVTMETVMSEKEQLMTRLTQEDHHHHELEGQIQVYKLLLDLLVCHTPSRS